MTFTPTPATRTETLVAVDFGPVEGVTPSIDHLVERMGSAVVSVESTERPHWKTGEPQPVYRIVFDANQLRNTEAHGLGFRCGFVVHVEPTS